MKALTYLSLLLFSLIAWAKPTILIKNIRLIDGTGAPAYAASVRLQGNKIIAIGKLSSLSTDEVVDGKGFVLAPGFIDSHSHHLGDVQRNPNAISTASQGITTIVVGQDGDSYPMGEIVEMLKKTPVAVNVASYTGQSALREQVMGEKNLYRAATQKEIDAMKLLLKKDLSAGSLGLSTGLEYEAAFYSTRDEVLQLAKVTADAKARYISHIRSEDITMADALDEILEIGRLAKLPVQISHIKLAKKDDWGSAARIIALLDKARKEGIDVTADIYPYTFWHSTPRVLFPKKDFTNLASAQFAVNQLFDPAESVLVHFAPNPTYKSKTISEIAALRGESPAQALISVVALAAEFRTKNPNYSGTIEAITGKSMSDQDVVDFMLWPHTNICSDGNAGAHPRGYGSFTRILGRYVREQKALSLEQAVYKMTGLTAAHLGLKDRGIIAPGKVADLVLFDPATVIDRATITNSQAISEGIEGVWVNGELVFTGNKPTGKRSGVLIKRIDE